MVVVVVVVVVFVLVLMLVLVLVLVLVAVVLVLVVRERCVALHPSVAPCFVVDPCMCTRAPSLANITTRTPHYAFVHLPPTPAPPPPPGTLEPGGPRHVLAPLPAPWAPQASERSLGAGVHPHHHHYHHHMHGAGSGERPWVGSHHHHHHCHPLPWVGSRP